MKHCTGSPQSGFALVVIAALFIAFSVIAAVLVERNSISAQAERQARAREQLSRIAIAMIDYSLVNQNSVSSTADGIGYNPFPCPARLDLPMTDPNFGVPLSGCHTGLFTLGTDGASLLPNNLAADNVIRGMVPVRALADFGIGVNDAIDPWNNRIMYVVNRNLTPNADPTTAATASNTPGNATLTITSFVGGLTATNPLTRPDFVLISYGPDGRGAYPKARTVITISCGAGTDLRDRNCSNTTSFARAPANTASNATAATYFDDIVTYYSR